MVRSHASSAGDSMVGGHGLGYLESNGVDRIERLCRLLESQPDDAAAYPVELFQRRRPDVDPAGPG